MFILLIMIYQILNALKSVSQVYYAGWVVHGNSYGNYAAIQAKFTMVAMAPMGPMLLVVVPMIKKFGRRKMIILGGIMAFVGATAAFFSAGDSLQCRRQYIDRLSRHGVFRYRRHVLRLYNDELSWRCHRSCGI